MIYVGGWTFGLAGAVEQMMAEAKNLLALAEQHRLNGFARMPPPSSAGD